MAGRRQSLLKQTLEILKMPLTCYSFLIHGASQWDNAAPNL